jgi:Kef-type K+ transport system membrane component KefB
MLFSRLLVLVGIGLLGPALANTKRPLVPLVVGEIIGGVLLGRSGFGVLDPADQPFPLFHDLGFALLMFTTGTNLNLGALALGSTLARTAGVVAFSFGLAVLLAFAVRGVADTGGVALYAVLLGATSAALVLPMVSERRLMQPSIGFAVTWIVIADVLALVAMPLAIGSREDLVPALVGDAAIVAVGLVVLIVAERFRELARARELRHRSRRRSWALQLRTAILLLLALGAIAERTHGSSLVAGFTAGLILTRLHEPGRLAKQVSGLADGFFVPAFFVLLGASLDLRGLVTDSSALALAAVLLGGSITVHLISGFVFAPQERLITGLLACGQLGLPAAAASIGLASGVFNPAQAAALVAAACCTAIPAAVAIALLERRIAALRPPPAQAPPAESFHQVGP